MTYWLVTNGCRVNGRTSFFSAKSFVITSPQLTSDPNDVTRSLLSSVFPAVGDYPERELLTAPDLDRIFLEKVPSDAFCRALIIDLEAKIERRRKQRRQKQGRR